MGQNRQVTRSRAAAVRTLVAAGLAGVGASTLRQALSIDVRRRWTSTLELPALTGYCDRPSVSHGQPIRLYVHTELPAEVRLLRMGEELEDAGEKWGLPVTLQSGQYDHWSGFAWKPTLEIASGGLRPGLHVAVLSSDDGTTFRIPIVLKAAEPVQVAVVACTNTWQAYNRFGGLSVYSDTVTPLPLRWVKHAMHVMNLAFTVGDRRRLPALPLPFRRPNSALDGDLEQLGKAPAADLSHLGRGEWELLRFLEREHVNYGVFSDHDFAFDPLTTAAKLVIFNVHSEYWSEEMVGQLVAYLGRGGHVLFLSGNNIYRKVAFLAEGLSLVDYKVSRTTMARLLGAAYSADGYVEYGGYRVFDPSHWAFRGLGVRRGQVFGSTPGEPGGASGFETDKVTGDSGPVTILAVGTNAEGPAFMVFKPSESGGGWILNCGSVACAAWLNRDPVLQGIVRNAVAEALHQG